MKCHVCHMPQPGPHLLRCSRRIRGYLHDGSTPWGEAPTRGAMLARLDAFCARYASTLEQDAREMRDVDAAQALWIKAAKVRAPFKGSTGR